MRFISAIAICISISRRGGGHDCLHCRGCSPSLWTYHFRRRTRPPWPPFSFWLPCCQTIAARPSSPIGSRAGIGRRWVLRRKSSGGERRHAEGQTLAAQPSGQVRVTAARSGDDGRRLKTRSIATKGGLCLESRVAGRRLVVKGALATQRFNSERPECGHGVRRALVGFVRIDRVSVRNDVASLEPQVASEQSVLRGVLSETLRRDFDGTGNVVGIDLHGKELPPTRGSVKIRIDGQALPSPGVGKIVEDGVLKTAVTREAEKQADERDRLKFLFGNDPAQFLHPFERYRRDHAACSHASFVRIEKEQTILFFQAEHFRSKPERHATPLQPLRRDLVKVGKAFPRTRELLVGN